MVTNSQPPLNNGPISSLGNNTKTTVLSLEADKMNLEFVAAASVKVGQPVKLTAAGKITPWAVSDGRKALVGYCYSDGAANDLVTVFTRGYMLIWALSNSTDAAGPACYRSYDTTNANNGNTGWNKYGAAAGDGSEDNSVNGWILDQAGAANTLVRVLLID